jgi:hypothetical protein
VKKKVNRNSSLVINRLLPLLRDCEKGGRKRQKRTLFSIQTGEKEIEEEEMAANDVLRVLVACVILIQMGRNGCDSAAVSRMMTVSNGNRGPSDYMISISHSDIDEKSITARVTQVSGSGPGAVVVHLSNEETAIQTPITQSNGLHLSTSPERRGGQEIMPEKSAAAQTASSSFPSPPSASLSKEISVRGETGCTSEVSAWPRV